MHNGKVPLHCPPEHRDAFLHKQGGLNIAMPGQIGFGRGYRETAAAKQPGVKEEQGRKITPRAPPPPRCFRGI